MSTIHGFEPKSMTDDEIMKKASDLSLKIGWASRSGMGYPVARLQEMLNMLMAEQRERAFMSFWNANQHRLTAPIETDPDIKAAQVAAEESKKVMPVRNRPRPVATSVPAKSNVKFPMPTRTPVLPPDPRRKKDKPNE